MNIYTWWTHFFCTEWKGRTRFGGHQRQVDLWRQNNSSCDHSVNDEYGDNDALVGKDMLVKLGTSASSWKKLLLALLRVLRPHLVLMCASLLLRALPIPNGLWLKWLTSHIMWILSNWSLYINITFCVVIYTLCDLYIIIFVNQLLLYVYYWRYSLVPI